MKVRTEARRQAIVEAAAELFQEMGYEGASMNELTKRLGGSKATLYGYFASKEALFVAVIQAYTTAHLSEATRDLSVEIAGRAALEAALTRFGERMMQVLTNDAAAIAVYRMVVAEAGRSEIGQLFHQAGPNQSIEALAGLFAAAMRRGEIRRADAKVTAMQFLGLVTAEINARLFLREPPPMTPAQIRQMVRRAVGMFFAGADPR